MLPWTMIGILTLDRYGATKRYEQGITLSWRGGFPARSRSMDLNSRYNNRLIVLRDI